MRYYIKVGSRYLKTPPEDIMFAEQSHMWSENIAEAHSYGERITAYYRKAWKCYGAEFIPLPPP